jgi:hypothetical protein
MKFNAVEQAGEIVLKWAVALFRDFAYGKARVSGQKSRCSFYEER